METFLDRTTHCQLSGSNSNAGKSAAHTFGA